MFIEHSIGSHITDIYEHMTLILTPFLTLSWNQCQREVILKGNKDLESLLNVNDWSCRRIKLTSVYLQNVTQKKNINREWEINCLFYY